MAGNTKPVVQASYDEFSNILTFSFTEHPQVGVAKEAADEIWVRHSEQTNRAISVDIHNFSHHVEASFGPSLTYTERVDPQRLDMLARLPLMTEYE